MASQVVVGGSSRKERHEKMAEDRMPAGEANAAGSGGPFIDTHCHLTFPQFADDLPEVLVRARAAGLESLITVGVDLDSSREAAALAGDAGSTIHAALGVHPHDARGWNEETEQELRQLASSPAVVAIGETGLDYYRDLSPRPLQRRVFERTLAIARELALPVIVHIREAHEDALALLEDFAAGAEGDGSGGRSPESGAGVLHCFSGGPEEAERAVGMGFLLGFGGAITYGRRPPAALKAVPRDRLLLETDCPYLTPVPYRGRRNEPAYLPLVAEVMAEALEAPVEEVARLTTANARRLFGLER